MAVSLGIDAAWTLKEPSGVAVVAGHPAAWRCIATAREYIGGLPARKRDEWDETLTLVGIFGLDAPVSLRQLQGKLWEIRVGRHPPCLCPQGQMTVNPGTEGVIVTVEDARIRMRRLPIS